MIIIRYFLLIVTSIIIVFFSLFYIGSQDQLIETFQNHKIQFLIGRILLNYIPILAYFLILLIPNNLLKNGLIKKNFKTDFIILNLISLIAVLSIYWDEII